MDTSTLCSVQGALADGLLAFTATCQNASTVKTAWLAAPQSGITSYTVQRSADGHAFDSLATLFANSAAQYTYYDNTAHAPVLYYRLKMLGSNGGYTFSRTVMVTPGTASPGIYPNPAKDQVTVTFNNPGAGPGVLYIKDAAGRTVLQRSIQVQAGYNSCTASVAGLAHALYYITLQVGRQQVVAGKLVKW
jgi:hypothetical protein